MPDHLTSRDQAERLLSDVEPMWRAFWFDPHLVAKNLAEFADGLGSARGQSFSYHVDGQKDELARWVREVIGDSVLSDQLAGIKDQKTAAALARARVDELLSLTKK